MTTKLRKLKTGSTAWRKALREMVIAECPALAECKACGHVIRAGYCCWWCGSTDPGDKAILPEEWM